MQKEEKNFLLSRRSKHFVSLKNQTAFNAVNLCGSKFKSRFFILVFAESQQVSINSPQFESNTCYLGFKVGRKIGNAVKRNLVKRRVKFFFRSCGYNGTALSCIFIARSNITNSTYSQLAAELERCLSYIIATHKTASCIT